MELLSDAVVDLTDEANVEASQDIPAEQARVDFSHLAQFPLSELVEQVDGLPYAVDDLIRATKTTAGSQGS